MTLEDQQTLQKTKRLQVKVYKDLHLNACNIDANIIDQWIERQIESLTELEKLLNHIHVYDLLPSVQDEDELKTVADEIARDWENALSNHDPRYRVLRYEGYGPEVTFYLDRGPSGGGRSGGHQD